MVADLITRANLTQEHAARLCGVSLKTISNWVAGRTRPSQQALSILETAAADAELESAEPMTLAERIAALRGIQQLQQSALRRLEDETETARRDLAATTSNLNALYAERGKLENAK